MSYTGDPFGQIVGLFTGRVETLWPGQAPSAIAKTRVEGLCHITASGLAGDMCADLSVHGGPDQAIHHYAADHMPFWQSRNKQQAAAFAPGCFGENVATTGLDEHNLCIGDVLSMGTARVQISQGRQPCWKLNAHIGRKDMAYAFRKTRKTGWYYRVLEPGVVTPDSFMHVVERPAPQWPIHDVITARFAREVSQDTAQQLSALAPLSAGWRAHFHKLCRVE